MGLRVDANHVSLAPLFDLNPVHSNQIAAAACCLACAGLIQIS